MSHTNKEFNKLYAQYVDAEDMRVQLLATTYTVLGLIVEALPLVEDCHPGESDWTRVKLLEQAKKRLEYTIVCGFREMPNAK